MVKNLQLGSAGAFSQDRDHPRLAVIDNKLNLSANDGVHGTEIWTSDGVLKTSPAGYSRFIRRNDQARRAQYVHGIWRPVCPDRCAPPT